MIKKRTMHTMCQARPEREPNRLANQLTDGNAPINQHFTKLTWS